MKNSDRDQMRQRYVAGKFLNGASLDEVANGYGDPVKEMNYITGTDLVRPNDPDKATSRHPGRSWTLLWTLLVLTLLYLCFSGSLRLP